MIDIMSVLGMFSNLFWGEEVSSVFLRKHYLASKLRVWINLICRIYLRINLSSDSGSMFANINYQFLPFCIKEVQDCSRPTNLLESVLQIEICSKKTWFSADTQNFYLPFVNSYLFLNVVVCCLWFHALLISLLLKLCDFCLFLHKKMTEMQKSVEEVFFREKL